MATIPPTSSTTEAASIRERSQQGRASKDKQWDTYVDHEHSVEFYVYFLQAAWARRSPRRRDLPVVRHHAHRGHLAGLARFSREVVLARVASCRRL